MPVRLLDHPFDPWRELVEHQASALPDASFGATAAFVGTMRDFAEGTSVHAMFLEHYPGMTERELEAIVAASRGEHEVLDVLVLHRVGAIRPAEPIVLVAAWSAHRAEAFAVCRSVMEALKSRAPFWKHERTERGDRWVECNTPGEPAGRGSSNAGG